MGRRIVAWAGRSHRIAGLVAALVLLAGVVAAAAEPVPAAPEVVASAGSNGPRDARRAASATTAPKADTTVPESVPATTAATAAPSASRAAAGPTTTSRDRPTTTTTTSVPWQPRWDFPGGSWDPGEPYPAEWASYDAAANFPPYPYVVPDVCRSGPNPWDARLTSATTVPIGDAGTITVTVNCVLFGSERPSYTVTTDGRIDIDVADPSRPDQHLLWSPRVACPSTLSGEPIPFGRSWTSAPIEVVDAIPAVGVTYVTVPVNWVALGWYNPWTDRPSSVLVCGQMARGTTDILVPLVMEPYNRPQEMGGGHRGPAPSLGGLAVTG